MWNSTIHAKTYKLKTTHHVGNVTVTHKQKTTKHKGWKTHIVQGITGSYRAIGLASWYGSESGNQTSTGAHFNPNGLTAAHRTLSLPTRVRVTNLKNHKSVIVTVNDRGPYIKGRLIDLSRGAAKAIQLAGIGMVRIETI
jgi:rare lipoprotein A